MPTPALVCDIAAPSPAHARALARIAADCARDLAQPLELRRQPAARERPARTETIVTLHLPAALAAAQHPIWCLACRLACFCPDARVSVLVEAADAFTSAPKRQRVRPPAAA